MTKLLAGIALLGLLGCQPPARLTPEQIWTGIKECQLSGLVPKANYYWHPDHLYITSIYCDLP